MTLPLKNKTVIVTRSENQAKYLIDQLNKLGAKTIALPLIQTIAINHPKLNEKLIQHNYNWIIFTSPNAVKFFFKNVSPKNITSKIAVVGSKTDELIKKLGLTVGFIPSQFTAVCLAKEIPINENDSILIPRSNLAKNAIVSILELRECSVDTLPIYENTSINYVKPELAVIFNQKVNFITFTSGSTVNSFIKLGIKLNQTKVVCIGPETAKVAKKNGLSVKAIANPHTIEGIIEELIKLSK